LKPLVIIGLGNRWRSDDGIGLELAEAVAACQIEDVECRSLESADALTLAHEMLELDAPCLIVDCADMGQEPGSYRYFGESDVKLGSARSTHGLGIAEALPLVGAVRPCWLNSAICWNRCWSTSNRVSTQASGVARMDEVIHCVQNIHVRELISRIHWAVRIRWAFISTLAVASLFSLILSYRYQIQPGYFIAVAVFLVMTNTIYSRQVAKADVACVGTLELQRLCFHQVLGDYMALAVVVYALGSVETPVMFLVLPNMLLAALFFDRKKSLALLIMGLGFVVAPLILEAAGILPVVTIFGSGLKEQMLSDPTVLLTYLGIFFACVMICWYLVLEITKTLIDNELELEDSYESMVRLDEEKTRATTRATHELKAPLAAIKSYVYTLDQGYAGELPEKARTIVNRIGARSDHLLAEITDIIRLSNLKTYVVTGEQLVPVDLCTAVAQEVRDAKALGNSRQISIRLSGADDQVVMVSATAEHLKTIISNLIHNAVNYSNDGGIVDVMIQRVHGDDGRNRVAVKVKDQGIGIAEEALKSVFDEHYRAKNAVDHNNTGTGLGLPIVKATARLLDAEVDLKSKLGAGTTATVTFNLLTGEHAHGTHHDN
jgi:hydrogenase maturation protease